MLNFELTDRIAIQHSTFSIQRWRLANKLLRIGLIRATNEGPMSEGSYVVQKVEWYQFRDTDGHAFFVMVSSLPNGFFTAVPCDIQMVRAEHGMMALAASTDEALSQLQSTLGGKTHAELFGGEH